LKGGELKKFCHFSLLCGSRMAQEGRAVAKRGEKREPKGGSICRDLYFKEKGGTQFSPL